MLDVEPPWSTPLRVFCGQGRTVLGVGHRAAVELLHIVMWVVLELGRQHPRLRLQHVLIELVLHNVSEQRQAHTTLGAAAAAEARTRTVRLENSRLYTDFTKFSSVGSV